MHQTELTPKGKKSYSTQSVFNTGKVYKEIRGYTLFFFKGSHKTRTTVKKTYRDFPGSPVVKTLRFHCRGRRFKPGWGTKIPHAEW